MKILLVLFFGYPIFIFMFMRMFLAMDGMKTTGQLLCDQEMIESLSDSLALNSVNLTSMLDGATYRPIGT